MLLSNDIINNKNNASINQNNWNNLDEKKKKEWISNIYKFYNKSIPLIKYSIDDINYCFSILKKEQNYKVIINNNNLYKFNKYDFSNLTKFINENKINKNNNDTSKLFYKVKDFLNITR